MVLSLKAKQLVSFGIFYLSFAIATIWSDKLLSEDASIHNPPERCKAYIKQMWPSLKRSPSNLHTMAIDPKLPPRPGELPIVYVPRSVDVEKIRKILASDMGDNFGKIKIEQLPENPKTLREHGLLYLPYPYIVPGGRFNEMYGWDSYFIMLGLLESGDLITAKGLVENALFEVRHYGKVLNANRTFSLSRSHPPFLGRMVLEQYNATGRADKEWLTAALPYVIADYQTWAQAPQAVNGSGLSHYDSSEATPAPEVVASERIGGLGHYDLAAAYFRDHPEETDGSFDRRRNILTPQFFRADRALRASGFDITGRFGPFGSETIHHFPVCLNSLLYQYAQDIATMLRLLGRDSEAQEWSIRAERRKHEMNQLLWNEKSGMYFDYNFKMNRQSSYPYLATFYPLWAGLASEHQAAKIVENLRLFEQAGGLSTSTIETGNQWDFPFGFAPLQLITIEGLRRYGYNKEADRISLKFISLILNEFGKTNNIFEKYDVVQRNAEVGPKIRFGYGTNEPGFGWTNAVYLRLLRLLSPAALRTLNTNTMTPATEIDRSIRLSSDPQSITPGVNNNRRSRY